MALQPCFGCFRAPASSDGVCDRCSALGLRTVGQVVCTLSVAQGRSVGEEFAIQRVLHQKSRRRGRRVA